jgi:hypothetical protein
LERRNQKNCGGSVKQEYINIGTPLIKLIEECSEVIQVLCKIDRFGLDSFHPETKESNRLQIARELCDLKLAIINYESFVKNVPVGADDHVNGISDELLFELAAKMAGEQDEN